MASPMTTTFCRTVIIDRSRFEQPELTQQKYGEEQIPLPFAPPLRIEGETPREMVIRILNQPSPEIEKEIYIRRKELLAWRRRIKKGMNTKARNRPRRKAIRAQIRWRAKELLAITDAFNMRQYWDRRQAYQKWQSDIMDAAHAEVERLDAAGEKWRDPKSPPTVDEELWAEREATRN